jgi:hypothetical protein
MILHLLHPWTFFILNDRGCRIELVRRGSWSMHVDCPAPEKGLVAQTKGTSTEGF